MFRRVALLAALHALPALADGESGKVERRLLVQKQLVDSVGTGCQFLSTLSRATPRTVVLSRLTYARVPGTLTLELSQGSKEDAEALLGALMTARLCATLNVTVEKGVVKGTCSFPAVVDKHTLRSASKLGDDGHSMLRTKLDEARVRIPDLPQQAEFEAAVREAAAKSGVSDLTVVMASPKISGPVDVVTLLVNARAGTSEALAFACELGTARRLTSVDTMEFGAPRPERAEWSVDFTFGVTTWRYRAEEEALDTTFETMKTAPAPPMKDFPFATRSPFGPADVEFVGARRTVGELDCREARDAKKVKAEVPLSTLAVAFAGPTCLMLVDEQGGCFTWKLKENGPDRFKYVGPEKGFAAVKRAVTDANGEVVPEVRYLIVPDKKPPPWLCK